MGRLDPPAHLEPPTRPARRLPRRAVLAASGAAALATAAACSSGGDPTGTTAGSPTASSPDSRPVPSPTAPSPTAPSATAGRPTTGTGSPTAAPEAAPDGAPLASVADVQTAGTVVVGDGADPYLLAYSGGTVVAHTAICTHQGCAVAATGVCPCHGSRFDVATGAVINGPALRPLEERSVTVSGGQVYAG